MRKGSVLKLVPYPARELNLDFDCWESQFSVVSSPRNQISMTYKAPLTRGIFVSA